MTIMSGGTRPWWSGVPTTLLRKTTLVKGNPATGRLPVHTLTFAIPTQQEDEHTCEGKAIPHRDIRLDLGDVVKMVIPGYKPKSYSVSALRDTEFDVTFKVYPNGRASGFLDSLQVGDTIHSFGMSARRTTRNVLGGGNSSVGIIAYGVGITEAFPVAAAELAKNEDQHVTLLWACRTWEDTFWHDELQALQQRYPNRFRLVHILSRQKVDGCLHGRINERVLERVFSTPGARQARFLSVGTKEMMFHTDELLEAIGCAMPEHALLPKTT